MPTEHSPATALYFPTIEFTNRSWLKSALLYWDAVRRIVPRHVEPNDTPDIAEVAASGAIVSTAPEPYTHGTEDRFRRAWTPEAVEAQRVAFQSIRNKRKSGGVEDEKWLWMHPEKLTYRLRDDFREMGALRPGERVDRVQPGLLQMYMTCLAAEIGDQIGVPTITDTVPRARAGQFLRFEDGHDRMDDRGSAYERAMLRLRLPLPVPSDLRKCSFSDILAFRERYESERRAFRDCIDGFASRIAALEDPNAVDDAILDAQKRLKQMERDYRKAVRSQIGEVAVSAMEITAPGAVVGAATAAFGQTSVVGMVAATLTGAGVWLYRNLKAVRQVRSSHPWRYVACLRKLRK